MLCDCKLKFTMAGSEISTLLLLRTIVTKLFSLNRNYGRAYYDERLMTRLDRFAKIPLFDSYELLFKF